MDIFKVAKQVALATLKRGLATLKKANKFK